MNWVLQFQTVLNELYDEISFAGFYILGCEVNHKINSRKKNASRQYLKKLLVHKTRYVFFALV